MVGHQEMKIDLNKVIESLANQVRELSVTIGYNDAIIASMNNEIKELEEEVENLRKEQIAEMDEDSSK